MSNLTDYEQRIVDCVQKDGWFCTSVFDPKGEAVGFSYSIGFLDTLKSPEFIIFGLSSSLRHQMLGIVFDQIQKGITVPGEKQRWRDVLRGHDCVSRAVHPSQIIKDYFNSALWYAKHIGIQREEVKAYQLFWPGANQGLFPWENDCDQIVRDLQPLLYLPREQGLA
jgi:hypothetical protein